MNDYEYQKELTKKRAHISFLTLILGLSTPTLFSISKQANLSIAIQGTLYLGLAASVIVCLVQKKQITEKLEKAKLSEQSNRKAS